VWFGVAHFDYEIDTMQLSNSPIMSTLETIDQDKLAIYKWPLGSDTTRRGTALLVHGLGEHMGRYAHVAKHLNELGFAVRGYDHFGHGLSTGDRGGLPSDSRMLDDLAKVIAGTRKTMPAGEPLVLIGHSMGGGVVGRFVALNIAPVDALVMSSPALDPGLNLVQKALLAVLPKIAPNLRIGNGLNANYICRDAAVVATYLADPLVHDRISARLASVIATSGAATIQAAPKWTTPTLLMFAGEDKLVSPAGSRAFGAAAPACVTTQAFEHMYHEIFNAPDQAQVFSVLKTWLDQTIKTSA
jgi:alpha-beta hydrolase superfamily lysophospholipase